ncbi:MAG: GH25 family lysozyme, partial [Vagococcus sp.]
MFIKKGTYFLLSTIVLGSLATVVPTFVEATDEQVGKIEMTEKSTQESEPSEKVGESLPEESEVNNKMDIKAADEGLEDGNTHEDAEEEDEFYYPSNRSDLTSSFRSYAAPRAKNDTISITDVNKPRADFIDVSSHNGYISVEEYKVIRSYGVKGVAVKLTEGTGYRNPEAKNQVANAKAAGLVVSAYHYSWFENEARARKEAQYFAQMANELGLPKSTLMINDLEDGKIKYKDNHTKNAKA